jgi:hypothetical protein
MSTKGEKGDKEMKKVMLVVFAASLMAAVILGPSSAQALCNQLLYAERSFTDGVTTQIVGRTDAVSTIIWFANTTDPELSRAITAAVSAHNRVFVQGDAASCPTTGVFRFMGNVTIIVINP